MSDIPSSDWSWIDAAAKRFERAWKQGTRPRIEDFLAKVPEPQRPALLAELVRVERELRQRAAEEPCAEEYRRRFPEHGDVVASVFAAGRASPVATDDASVPKPTIPGSTSVGSMPTSLPVELANHPDYEIVRKLAGGAMGAVWLARNRLMGRDEVLKVMSQHIVEQPGVLDRFLREIRAVARLRHPNIVSAYTAFRCGAHLVFAMEYVEGLDLRRMVKAKGAMPIGHACYFVHQAALGLQHAHEEGMVHRDIKPGNLMLSHDKNRAVIKILDFGLAKATSEHNPGELALSVPVPHMDLGEHLTSTGEMLGTPDFIAPEQIVDAQNADIRADVYSLGCTLYYLLSGHPPYPDRVLRDVLKAHRSLHAAPLDGIRAEIPVELSALVARMMAKDPASRFQEPRDVAAALTPFFKKRSEIAGTTSFGTFAVAPPNAEHGSTEATQAQTDAPAASGADSERAMERPEATMATPIHPSGAEDQEVGIVAAVKRAGKRVHLPRLAAAGALLLTGMVLGAILVHVAPKKHPAKQDAANTYRPDAPGTVKQAESMTHTPQSLDSAKDGSANVKGERAVGGRGPDPPNENETLRARQDAHVKRTDAGVRIPGETAHSRVHNAMRWSGAVYIVGTEEDVRGRAEKVRQRALEYRRAVLDLQHLDESNTHEMSAGEDLTRRREALNQQNSALSADLANLSQQHAVASHCKRLLAETGMTFYADGFGVRISVADLDQQIALLSNQIDRHRASLDQIRSQLNELVSEIDKQRRAAARLEVVAKLHAETDQRDAYLKALRALRESVDATKRRYSDLAGNAEVRAELATKNHGLPQNKFSLGPSPGFLEIERKLTLHEDWVKSSAASRGRPGNAQTALTRAGGLPPDF